MLPKAEYYAFERLSFTPTELEDAGPWDFLLSAYDRTDRVQIPFNNIQANNKQWIVHEEYELPQQEWPSGAIELRGSFDPPAIPRIR